MSWIDLGLLSLQYGPSLIILIGLIYLVKPGYKWKKDIEQQLVDHDIQHKKCEDNMKNIHDGCHIPIGAMKKVEEKIAALEAKDNQIEVDITGIRTKLDSVEVMTRQIHDHFLGEGLKGTNRRCTDQ